MSVVIGFYVFVFYVVFPLHQIVQDIKAIFIDQNYFFQKKLDINAIFYYCVLLLCLTSH
jgi:hypothetical protein